MFKYNKLKGRIVEKYSNVTKFASAYGITRQALHRKFQNKNGLSQTDIVKMAKLLDIEESQYGYFFYN